MFEGQKEHEYREATALRAGKMAGVTTQMTFVCKACGHIKQTKGRKLITPDCPRFGYRCADCAVR